MSAGLDLRLYIANMNHGDHYSVTDLLPSHAQTKNRLLAQQVDMCPLHHIIPIAIIIVAACS